MELWIRSQDKEILTLAEHLDIYNAGVEEQCWAIEESGTDLGTYKTKERALEVLDEIQNILIPQEYPIATNRNTYKNITDISTYVYEMPEE